MFLLLLSSSSFFNTLNILISCSLIVSEKPMVILILVPLQMKWFPTPTPRFFQAFPFVFDFSAVWIWYSQVYVFWYLFLVVFSELPRSVTWCRSLILKKFWPLLLKIFLMIHFLSSLSGILITCIYNFWNYLVVLGCFILFWVFFYFSFFCFFAFHFGKFLLT